MEKDIASGARYYVKLNPYGATPLHSTWTKPESFARLFRQPSAFSFNNSCTSSSTENGNYHEGYNNNYDPVGNNYYSNEDANGWSYDENGDEILEK